MISQPDSTTPSDLPVYAVRLLEEAMQLSGYPIGVRQTLDPELGYHVSIGSAERPFHVLQYSTKNSRHELHYLVSLAAHITRLWRVPPSKRVCPAYSDRAHLPEPEHAELVRAYRGASPDKVMAVSRHLYHMITGMATSLPLSLRIEEELYRQIEEHRPLQRAYHQEVLTQADHLIDPELKRQPPRKATRALTALSTMHIECLSSLSSLEPGQNFQNHADRDLIAPLLSAKRENRLIGFYGDVWLTNAWARHLGIRRWYRWERLE